MSATKTRIMYLQRGTEPGRIGRVRLSKTGRTLHYGDVELTPVRCAKANYIDAATSELYWVSGPRADGQDTLYPATVTIDDDVRDEYWRLIRGESQSVRLTSFRSLGVHAKHATR